MTTPNNIEADKTRVTFPIPMLVTVALGLLSIGGSHVANAAKADRLEAQMIPVVEEQRTQAQEQRIQELRTQRLEDRFDHIAKALDEIKTDLKRNR